MNATVTYQGDTAYGWVVNRLGDEKEFGISQNPALAVEFKSHAEARRVIKQLESRGLNGKYTIRK